jgi:aryl-alcohol dehydrogenase-like predicted oxidoreductase
MTTNLACRMNRRQFLADLGSCVGAGALMAPTLAAPLTPEAATNAAGIPLRTLGRTKAQVTTVGLGTACIGHSMPGAATGVPVYRAAMEAGINLIDTARGYDDAEGYLGELMGEWRDKIFLTTKAMPGGDTPAQAARAMQRDFEQSLRLLKTDHVDLLYIHNVGNFPPENILGPGGALDFARQMKDTGKTRFIGITGHCRVPRFADILKTGEIDALMVVLNFVDYHTYRFEEQVLPEARRQGCGIIAMKVFGGHGRGFAGYRHRGPARMPAEHLENALRYSLGIEGVASAVLGAYTIEEVRQNVAWAKRGAALAPDERVALREQGQKLMAAWGSRFGPAT